MNRRQFIKTSALSLGALSFATNCSTLKKSKSNIIMILADDMGFSDIGCYGSEIKTPNLDSLAKKGTRFSQFYNNARCCPSRAALLTGVYPHQAGIGGMTDTDVPIPEYQGFFNENVVTLADVLKTAGYKTYMSGKWHVGDEEGHWPCDHGFDESFAFLNGASGYFDFQPYRNKKWPPGNQLTVVENDKKVTVPEDDLYVTDLYTDKAINFIKSHQSEAPFFLYLGYTAPHWPMHALPEDIAKYRGYYDDGWNAIRQKRFSRLKELGIIDQNSRLSPPIQPEKTWESLSKEEREREIQLMEVYAAMVDRMDQNIGRLIAELKSNDKFYNTVILFLSDNGGCAAGNIAWSSYSHDRFDPEAKPGTPESFTGYGKKWANVSNTPFRQFKTKVHEGGIATPFIAWYPKRFKQNQIDHTVAHIVDVMPTLAEIGGTQYPQQFKENTIKPAEGKSLLGVLKGKEQITDRCFYFEHMGNCGVIDGTWKLVKFRDEPWELYDISIDRSETENLARENPEKLNEMVEKYEDWAKKNKVLAREEVEQQIPYKF